MQWRIATLLSVICCVLYANTLTSDFVFDDHHAVVENKDVTHKEIRLTDLLRHDFWGQDIAGTQSHKSYRPVTVLSFRLLAFIARRCPTPSQRQPGQDPSAPSDKPPPFGTLPFHVANVALHCIVTCGVYCLAEHLRKLQHTSDGRTGTKQEAIKTTAAAAAAASQIGSQHHISKQRSAAAARPSQGAASVAPAIHQTNRQGHEAEAALAALLFAAHPVHTEAVAGIVGHAELQCAMFFIAALLTYTCGVNGANAERSTAQWRLVAAALALVLLAALAKEIGITVVVPMLLYDVMLSPASAHTGGHMSHRHHMPLRVAALVGVAAAYVGIRQTVSGGQQLVAIFRKVENPIPFAGSRLTRGLSIGYLHAAYFGLLLAPWRLSADWSFSCVPLVTSGWDSRNAATAALYMLVACMAWLALRLLHHMYTSPDSGGSRGSGCSSHSQGGNGIKHAASTAAAAGAAAAAAAVSPGSANSWTTEARWAVVVFFGLLAAPFLPSSNLLLYVGTFIGERLLYIPSIGFCILLARLLLAADGCLAAGMWHTSCLPAAVRRSFMPVVVSTILAIYAARTVTRNLDWRSESTLFKSALQVCPDSAKVQLNNGILSRRSSDWGTALAHFERAEQIEPTYCEPDFWSGLTLLNANRTTQGLKRLEAAIDCPYVSAKSLQALNQAYVVMHATSRQGSGYMQDWARVLAKANRTAEACDVYEQLAGLALTGRRKSGNDAAFAEQMAHLCLAAIRQQQGANLPLAVAHGSAGTGLQRLADCVRARAKLRSTLLQHAPPESAAGLRAVHDYLTETQQRCRGHATAAEASASASGGGVDAPGRAQQPAVLGRAAHTAAVHAVQSRHAADPHLQAEWAAILVADGRFADAMRHYQAAGVMFTGQHAHQAGADQLMHLGLRRPMSAEDKAAASAGAFNAATQLQPDSKSLCALMQSKCSALGWLHTASASDAAAGSIAGVWSSCLNDLQQQNCAALLV